MNLKDKSKATPISFITAEVIKRVRRGDDATACAGGLNGITYKSLKIWFLKNDLLADKLTELSNQIAAGDILEEVVSF